MKRRGVKENIDTQWIYLKRRESGGYVSFARENWEKKRKEKENMEE